MTTNKINHSIRWVAFGLVLLLSPLARAQWEAHFTGEITDITDPDGLFQGLVAPGTAVDGYYAYDPTGPAYSLPGTFRLTLGSVIATNYTDMYIGVIHDQSWFPGDDFSFQTYTPYPAEFKWPDADVADAGLLIELTDPSGTALTGSELLDLPLGNAWLGSFSIATAEYTLWTYNPETFAYVALASARFRFLSYETTLSSPMIYASPRYNSTTETNGTVTITVRRAGDASGSASVDYTTADGSAQASADYIAASGTLSFAAGVRSQSFTITILDDPLQDGYEDFFIDFSNVSGAASTVGSASVSIADDEPPLPYLFTGESKATEVSGVATISVTRYGDDLSQPTTVKYTTVDDTAVAGEDYVATSGTLTFAPGESTKSFTIALVKNIVAEPKEQFFVNFSDVIGGQPASFTATVNIYDPVPVAVDPTFNPGVGTDQVVFDLFPTFNGKILAMGDFSTIGGVSRKFLARLNNNGTTDPTFTAGGGQGDLDRAPFRLLELPGGLVMIAGEFTTVGGQSQPYLARLRPDGSFDRSFRPNINGPVLSMARQDDGLILIGGDFTEINGIPRQRVARLNPKGLVDKSFNAGTGPDSPVFALAVQPDGRILVGGYFSDFSGSPRQLVARLNSNGTLDPGYSLHFTFEGSPALGGLATKFIVRPDGSHYLVWRGFATEVNAHHSPHLALINANGTVNTGFRLNFGVQTFALNPNAVELLPDGRLIAACAAAWFTETTIESAALVLIRPNGDMDPGLDPFNFVGGFGPPTDNLQMWEVAVQPDGKYLIAGTFADVAGVPRKGMARIIVP